MAIEWLSKSMMSDSIIFSDSLSSVTSLRTGRSQERPNSLTKLIAKIDKLSHKPKIVWIPSHVGISGNNKADYMAKVATYR